MFACFHMENIVLPTNCENELRAQQLKLPPSTSKYISSDMAVRPVNEYLGKSSESPGFFEPPNIGSYENLIHGDS